MLFPHASNWMWKNIWKGSVLFLASEILSIPIFPKIVFGTLWADVSGTAETKYDESTFSWLGLSKLDMCNALSYKFLVRKPIRDTSKEKYTYNGQHKDMKVYEFADSAFEWHCKSFHSC
jgi:hypothetical protein